MIDWLLDPIDAARAHAVSGPISWHARLMVLAWVVLVPLGVIAARYLKITPWQDWPRELDNRTWWNLHRTAQYSAGALSIVALALAFWHLAPITSLTSGAWAHHWLGWSVLGLAGVQYLSAWLRGSKGGPTAPAPDGSLHGDHFDMTPRRVAFEWIHKSVGMGLIGLAMVAVVTGLWQLNAPRWMWLAIGLWWIGLALAVIVLERRLGARDTYEAIWGPDPSLPGQARKPIGLFVRRHSVR